MLSRIAVLQMCSGIDPKVNAEVLEQAITDAAGGGAQMLFTPEMSGLLDSQRARAAAYIVPESEEAVLQVVQAAAAQHGLWVALGSLALTSEMNGKNANRSFLINAQGEIVARYDKMHLFDVDLPSGESWRESNAYAAGKQAVVAQTPLGRLGLSICYDVRFPALYAALSGAGAQIIAVPAAFTVPTGKAHWHTLLRARAIENAAFIIAAAQAGTHEDGRTTYGHSLVVSPWGEVLLDMAEKVGLAFVDIDLAQVAQVRQRIPVLEHRRPIPHVQSL